MITKFLVVGDTQGVDCPCNKVISSHNLFSRACKSAWKYFPDYAQIHIVECVIVGNVVSIKEVSLIDKVVTESNPHYCIDIPLRLSEWGVEPLDDVAYRDYVIKLQEYAIDYYRDRFNLGKATHYLYAYK